MLTPGNLSLSAAVSVSVAWEAVSSLISGASYRRRLVEKSDVSVVYA